AIKQMAILQKLVVDVRNRRAELKVESKQKAPIRIFTQPGTRSLIETNRELVEKLASVENIEFAESSIATTPGVQTTSHYELSVLYEKKIDPAAERERLGKELKKL